MFTETDPIVADKMFTDYLGRVQSIMDVSAVIQKVSVVQMKL